MMKSKKSLFVVCMLIVSFVVSVLPVQAAIPGISSSRYMKGYTKYAGSNVHVYTSSALNKYGTASPYKEYNALIYPNDELYIYSMNDRYAYVSYDTSSGRRKGYVYTSTITDNNWSVGAQTSRAKINVYKKSGGAYYGYIDQNDSVWTLSRGSYTQVAYPCGSLYKVGYISNADYDKYIAQNGSSVNVSNGTYTFYSAVGSNKVLDVWNNSNANGANIQLYDSNGTNAQKFNVSSLGSGWYKIANVNAKVLDVAGGVAGSGVNVQLYEWNGTYAQQWRFFSLGNGYYQIQNRLGYYLDVNGAVSTNGTNIQTWEKNSTNAQKWKLTSTSSNNNTQNNGNNWDSKVGTTVANINSYYYTTGNLSYRGGYKGQCTWYAYGRFYEVNGIALGSARHAKYWLSDNRNKSNVRVVSTIQPKSIAVRTSGTYGHVMFVEEVVYSNGSPQYVYFTECNSDGNGVYDKGKDCIVKKLSYSSFVSQKNPAGYIVKW